MARFSDGYSGFAGNADQQVRERQLLVGEPGAFGAKQHRRRAARAHLEDALRGLVQIERAEVLVARTRGGGGHEAAVGNRLGDAVHHARARQQIVGARGARRGLRRAGNALGRTSTSSASAMFFMARATAPMFPGCEGSTSTMRMAVSGTACIIAALFGTPLSRCSPYSISRSTPRAAPATSSSAPSRASKPSRSTARAATTYVTEVDRAAEADIIETIRRLHPDHAIPRRGKRRHRATATWSGSSIRSMAPRISCTAFRPSPCPSPARSGAAWNMPWCSIPCARRCSPPRAATARRSRAARCASASRSRSKAR